MITLSLTVDGIESTIEKAKKFNTFFQTYEFVEDLSQASVRVFESNFKPNGIGRIDYRLKSDDKGVSSEIFVKSEFKYLFFVDRGTPAHVINGKPILTWIDKQSEKRLFATKVNHPGIQATHWIDKGGQRIAQTFVAMTQEALSELR